MMRDARRLATALPGDVVLRGRYGRNRGLLRHALLDAARVDSGPPLVDRMARYAPAMPDRSRNRPRDPNQLAKLIVDLATGEADETSPKDTRDPAAVALGRKGGLKGGKARAAKMTPEERSEAARKAAAARWKMH